jgi:mRNA interferase MazF
MTTKPGEVYRVDLGMGGKVRMMLVVSREDADAPRALSLCVPITTSTRNSDYEVELPSRPFLRAKSFANVQGLQAIQHHELVGPVGVIYGEALDRVKAALRHALDLC